MSAINNRERARSSGVSAHQRGSAALAAIPHPAAISAISAGMAATARPPRQQRGNHLHVIARLAGRRLARRQARSPQRAQGGWSALGPEGTR